MKTETIKNIEVFYMCDTNEIYSNKTEIKVPYTKDEYN